MPPDNVETVRRSFDSYAAGGLDALAEFWHPDINWRAIEGAADDVGEMHGAEAMRGYIQEWIDMFDDLRLVAEDVRAVGDGRVVAQQCVSGRAKISGAETELHYAVVYTLRDGKFVHGREYRSFDEALEAAGVKR
jgi:uncharacterized protein